jgi:carboxypeptidase PM20D1
VRKLLALLAIVVLGLAIAVGVKTYASGSRQIEIASAAPVLVDSAAVAERLGAAVRFRTVASHDDTSANAAEFDGLHALLQRSFPRAHAMLKREAITGSGLIYTWAGVDAKAPAFALMAHQDVVPVAPGTEIDWQQPAFSGMVKDGFVWGRGSWDDKGNLMSIMEAVEMLAASGFRPRQTIYLIFGQDEEIRDPRGAATMAQLLRERGVHLQFLLDEGLLITEGIIAGLDKPTAFVGLSEKGALSVKLTANAAGGHSSMPPAEPGQSAIGMLSIALARLEKEQMPSAIQGLSRQTFETIAPEMSGMNRVFLSNLWLFGPLVEQQLKKSPSTNAALRTTTALTVVNGGNADNVLPGRATAIVNFRLLPGDTSDAVVEHVKRVIANPKIVVEKASGAVEASRTARTDAPGYRLIGQTLRQLHPDTIVAPGLMIGATDSRWFEGVADDIYKFSPVRARVEDLKRFHGTNERISIDNYVELIQFYHRLISNAQLAP